MAASTSSNPSPKSGAIATGLTILILVALVAAVVGISFLPNPYYAIGEVLIYAGLVALVAGKLRACLRLAYGSEYSTTLYGIIFWVVLGVFSVVARLEDLFSTENREYIRMATSGALYLALLFSLQMIEQLLKRGAATTLAAGAVTNIPKTKADPKPDTAPDREGK